ncbi:MAG: DUF5719 family protein [Nitriliruptorales bacterium]
MRPFTASLTLSLAVVVAVGAGAAADVALGPVEPPPTPHVEAAEAVSGAWYCAVGETLGRDELSVLGAVAPGRATSANLRIHSFGSGGVIRSGEVEVLPAAVRSVPVRAGQDDIGVVAQWWGTPAAVFRVWRRTVVGEPSGLVVGPCQSQPNSSWYLPGISTDGGAHASIVLANPFPTDAAVSVTLLTPEGPLEPELLKNVAVQGRGIRVIELNDHAPERSDIGAVVTVRAGRVVAEAWQALDAAIGGVEGLTLARLAPAAAETWTVPWIPGRDLDTWVWVANPDDRPASLAFTVHTATGGSPLQGTDEVLVPAGGVRRMSLRGLLPDGAGEGAVTVTATNGVPVVVSGAVRVSGGGQVPPEQEEDGEAPPGQEEDGEAPPGQEEDGEAPPEQEEDGEAPPGNGDGAGAAEPFFSADGTGFAIQLAQPSHDAFWVLAGIGTRGRSEVLRLVNPTSQPATVTVRVAVETATLAPEELQGIRVPAGSARSVDIAAVLPELASHALFVEANGAGVVAGLRSAAIEAPLELVTNTGVPGATWAPRAPAAHVEFSPGLARRVGTSSGPALSPPETPPPATELDFEPSPDPAASPTE